MESTTSAKDILEGILDNLGIENNVSYDELAHSLDIDSPDHALLIGKRGDNLRALQHIVNVILRRQNHDAHWVVIDVAGYKKEKLQKLEVIAEDITKEVITSGRDKRLPIMNSFERRHIHTYLSENPDIVTESEGEEPNRLIVVKKAN